MQPDVCSRNPPAAASSSLLFVELPPPWGLHGFSGHAKTCLSTGSGPRGWHLLSSTGRRDLSLRAAVAQGWVPCALGRGAAVLDHGSLGREGAMHRVVYRVWVQNASVSLPPHLLLLHLGACPSTGLAVQPCKHTA